jgi:hypothetical protein
MKAGALRQEVPENIAEPIGLLRTSEIRLKGNARVEVPSQEQDRVLGSLYRSSHRVKVGRAVDENRDAAGMLRPPAGRTCPEQSLVVILDR